VSQREDGLSGGHQPRTLCVIALELPAPGVEFEALELDDEPCLGPVGVDGRRITVDDDVPLVRREIVPAHKVMEEPLELRPSLGRRRRVVLEQRQQVLEAAAAVAAIDQRLELREVEEPQLLRLLVRPLELVRRHDLGEVQQRPLHGGA
jgi:hypothetical protein